MTGGAIAAAAIGDACLRALATEYGGPRPAGTRDPARPPPRAATQRSTRP
jgi:hypothetical protein